MTGCSARLTAQLSSALRSPPGFTQTHTASTPLSDELVAQFQFMTPCGRWKNKSKIQARFETFFQVFFVVVVDDPQTDIVLELGVIS